MPSRRGPSRSGESCITTTKVLGSKGCSAAQPAAALLLTKIASVAVMKALREEEGERAECTPEMALTQVKVRPRSYSRHIGSSPTQARGRISKKKKKHVVAWIEVGHLVGQLPTHNVEVLLGGLSLGLSV